MSRMARTSRGDGAPLARFGPAKVRAALAARAARGSLAAPAALAGLAVAFAMGAPRAANAATIALTGGTVHTVSGPTIQNGTVVIRDGKIAAVGANLQPPPDAQVVPCNGKHVYPGMIAANTILGLTEIESVRGTDDATETGNLNPNIRAEVEINPESDLLPVARVNGITSAVVIPRGGAIAGTAALIHLVGWTYEDMTQKAPLGLYVQWPGMTARTDELRKTRDQAVDAIRQAFLDARAYWKARDAEGSRAIPRHDRDVKWDAMGRALRGEIPVMFAASAANQIRAVLDFADEIGLSRIVLVDGYDAWRFADELKSRHVSVIAGPILPGPGRRDEPYDQRYTIAAKLQAAGIPFCISDGGGSWNSRNLPYCAAMAAAFGLPRDEALKSVTLYPAQILGVSDRVGSIEVGKVADLFVADGDPLEIATHIEQVWIDGEKVSMSTRQTRLFEKYDAKPRGPAARKR